MDNVVVVSHLPKTYTNKSVQQYFKDAGDVLNVERVTSDTAFVTFKTHDNAVCAEKMKHNTEFGDKIIQVHLYSCFFSDQFWSCAFTETINYFEIKIGKCAVDKLISDVALTCTISDSIMCVQGRLWLRLPEYVGITFLRENQEYKINFVKVTTARQFFRQFKPLKYLLETSRSCTTPPLSVSGRQHSFPFSEIIIPGVNPMHTAVLLKSDFLKEWFKDQNYGQEAMVDEGDNSEKNKVTEENVHSARDKIIRYMENITEKKFSVSHEIAKMYTGKYAKEWVQQQLNKSEKACQWEFTKNIITVVAHKADHPVLREFFETVFRKDNTDIEESEPLHSDKWNRFLQENSKQNKENQPLTVVQISGISSITNVVRSNTDSTTAAVQEFLPRNTVDSNKATLPEKVTTDLQTHTDVSSSPCSVQEPLEQTSSDTVLNINDNFQFNIEAEKKTKSQQEIKGEICLEVRENMEAEHVILYVHLDPDGDVLHLVHNQHKPVKPSALDSELKDEGDTEKHKDCKDGENVKVFADVSQTTDRKEQTKESATKFNESHGRGDSHHGNSYKLDDPKKTCMDSDAMTLSGVGHDRLSRAGHTTHLAAETADTGAQEDLNNMSLSLDDVSFSCPGLVGSDSEPTLSKLQDEGAVSATNGNLPGPAQSPDDGSLLCECTNTTGNGCTSGDIPEVGAEIQDTSVDNADTDSGDDPWKQLDCLEIDQLMVVARSIGISDQCVSDLRSRYSVDEDFRCNLIDRCATTGNTSRLCRALLLLVQKYSVQKKQAQSLCGATATRPAAEKEPPSSDNPTLSSSTIHPINYEIKRGQYKHFDSDHNLPHARTGHGSDSFMQHSFTGPFPFPAAQNISRSPSNMSYRSWSERSGFMYPQCSFDQGSGDLSGSFQSNTVPKIHVQGQRFASETGHQSQEAWTEIHTEAASPEQTRLGYLQSHRQRNQAELSTEPRRETSAKSQMDPKFSPDLTAKEEKEKAQAATSPQQQCPCCHHRTNDEMYTRFAQIEQHLRETLAHAEIQMQTRTEVQFQMRLQTAMEAQELVHLAQRSAFETRLQAQIEARIDHLGEQMRALHTEVVDLKQQHLVIDNGSETTHSAPSLSVSEHDM